ncbi:Metallo-dependent phosphatase-like protein [Lasiosphaeria miniovina]|uniref:Metallo-dependent phosphatase-like protein n=1 Tax=Lasiosphaeria miniovina TaxID=1954250 RepID=A0AA40B4A6_9PEZI|nr:Metallo-dependent phosphatase-like protein [Lasiosphaeria miniovina]KAK0727438.1 Metallo-dependent phosphatase-like protein [Lasiosphaeria miniovina]
MAMSSVSLRKTRRTRFVCISDTHNATIKLPKGDVLIHAGDLTNQGSYSELSKATQWLESADFEVKIVIAVECSSLLTSSRTITYLRHSSATIRLSNPAGPRTEFTVFGSPYSPRNGLWAFGYDQDSATSGAQTVDTIGKSASEIWAAIPRNTDILITHTPPRNHCNGGSDRNNQLGCEELRKVIGRTRPRLHVCGHIHRARGAERVTWKLGNPDYEDGTCAEVAGVEYWEDPSPGSRSAKISLVDLTDRGVKRSPDPWLASNAAGLAEENPSDNFNSPHQAGGGLICPALSGSESQPATRPSDQAGQDGDLGTRSNQSPGCSPGTGPLGSQGAGSVQGNPAEPPDRMSRRETCIVNCAIMASNWPHAGGRRFNKPIVVDLDLPVWR